MGAERRNDALNLLGELAHWHQHKNLNRLQRGINTAKRAECKCARLARARLGLRKNIAALLDRDNALLLNGRRLLKAVAIDPAQNRLWQVH